MIGFSPSGPWFIGAFQPIKRSRRSYHAHRLCRLTLWTHPPARCHKLFMVVDGGVLPWMGLFHAQRVRGATATSHGHKKSSGTRRLMAQSGHQGLARDLSAIEV